MLTASANCPEMFGDRLARCCAKPRGHEATRTSPCISADEGDNCFHGPATLSACLSHDAAHVDHARLGTGQAAAQIRQSVNSQEQLRRSLCGSYPVCCAARAVQNVLTESVGRAMRKQLRPVLALQRRSSREGGRPSTQVQSSLQGSGWPSAYSVPGLGRTQR
jgi:hypothetical protein